MPAYELIHDLLERSAQTNAEKPFLIQDGVRTSYGDVEHRSNQLARALVGQGLSQGDRVALLAANSAFYVEAYFGILKAGGIVVPINTSINAPAVSQIMATCDVRVVLADNRHEKTAAEAASTSRVVDVLAVAGISQQLESSSRVRFVDLANVCPSEPSQPYRTEIQPRDYANIIFTSGSTGQPRGAALSHRNIVSNARSIVEYLSLRAEDRVLQVLPFHYVYGQSLLITHALVGGTIVIENRFMYPKVALDTLEETACTGFSGVPSSFAILLNRSDFAKREFPSLRYVTAAGGAMSPALTRRLIAALPGKELFIMYGATEASARLSFLSPADLPRKIGSIGKAIRGVELRVLGKDNREAAPGEIGEIVANGPNIMSGYWGDKMATEEVRDVHGYHTGDLAYRDEEGFLFIVGRIRDFIKVGAHRVPAKEVEEAIAEMPDVHEVAVVGRKDDILGEVICAFVVRIDSSAIDADQLKKLLRKRLPLYKVPTHITFVEDLPRSAAGKVLKQKLSGLPDSR
jgi:acyl-CoA synthetase (AMP-forming)/AMP-acid ligase II